jgi:glycosyltransferase involved in cell wall biosynthesis
MTLCPLVSCIMPTYNRRQFVGQAIWYFLRQDYTPRELLILDDGEDVIDDLVPDDPRIHYVRLDGRRSLGAKRNLACEISRGELICYWDDDDWMAPQRLSLQVAALLESGADVCGARQLLHYRLQAGEAWLYSYPAGERPWLAGPTLLYRRTAWEACRFADLQVGEDTNFVWRMPPDRLHAMTNHDFYVAVIHERNTAAKNLQDSRWQRQSLDVVGRLLLADRDFYAALRNGGRPTPLVQRTTTQTVTVAAPFLIYDGYGSMSEYLVHGMARAGATLNIVPLTFEPSGLSEELQPLLKHPRSLPHAPVLYFS